MTAGHAETPLCGICGLPLARRAGEFYCDSPDGFVLRDGAPVEAHAGAAEVGAVGTQPGEPELDYSEWEMENGYGLD